MKRPLSSQMEEDPNFDVEEVDRRVRAWVVRLEWLENQVC